MRVIISKAARTLALLDGEREVFRCRVALGREPVGPKRAENDGKTPEGRYHICLIKERGKYGRSLGLNYPGVWDARLAFAEGRIDQNTLEAVCRAHAQGCRPPWGSPLGGEIYVHEGGTARDWTQGCVALESADMDSVYAAVARGDVDEVEIRA